MPKKGGKIRVRVKAAMIAERREPGIDLSV